LPPWQSRIAVKGHTASHDNAARLFARGHEVLVCPGADFLAPETETQAREALRNALDVVRVVEQALAPDARAS
jgi:hypothetical protein